MKKVILLFAAYVLFAVYSYGQINQGGLPVSFDKQKNTLLQSNIPIVTMPLVDVTKLESEDITNDRNKEIPWRFGNNIPVDIDLISGGVKDILPNGDKIWRTRIYSQGALTMNFAFDKYLLPENAKLYFYNDQQSRILGAFTDFNNQADKYFATTLIEGEAITIEYYEPANADFQGQLHLFRVTHGYRNVLDFTAKQAKSLGSSGSCEFNVKCSLGTGWENEIRSACMLVTGGSGFCSASLVNNVLNDGTPYVLTANHCSTSNDWATWVFWFNWQSATCTNPSTSPAYNSISGGTLKARSGSSDFCLVQMTSTPPSNFNVYYAGWDRSGAATQSIMGIHHPAGDIKKISHATVTNAGVYSSVQCWNVFWAINGSGAPIEGVTEGGSSGSPIFDANHRIIGQLYGGPSSCSASGAANVNDFYGRFSYSWDSCGSTNTVRLKDWLDPQNTNPPFIAGYDPNVPAVALDASPSSIIEPFSSYCTVQQVAPKVIIRNVGSTALNSLSVSYNIDGGTNITQSWTGNLATNATDTIIFSTIALTVGNHSIHTSTTNPNATSDQNAANDTLSKSFIVASAGSALPFTEDFETTTFPPTNFTIDNPDAATTWTRNTNATGNGTSTGCAYINLRNYTTLNQKDGVVLPKLDFTGLINIQMTFKVAYRRYSATNSDTLEILVSTDCGTTYNVNPVYRKGGTTLATGADMTTAFTPTQASDWRLETINLTAFAGSNLVIKIQSTNRRGNNLYIDDINIYSSAVPPVADFTQSDTTTCAGIIKFTDLSNNTPASWLWDFGDATTDTIQNPSHTYTQSGYYTVSLTATNQYGNNTVIKTNLIHINFPALPTGFPASRCGTGTVTLTASGSGNLEWYDASTAGNMVGNGTSFTTPSISSNTTYYVENHTTTPSQYFGNTQSNSSGSFYTNAALYGLNFDAFTDFKLVSVEVNAGATGSKQISLINSAGTTINSATVTVPAGVSRITLNFDVPAGTGYRLVGPGSANLWRVNTGVAYPYLLAGVASITSGGTGTTIVTNRYYYFYNWEVQQYGCVSARTPVTASINSGIVAGTATASPTSICGNTSSILSLTGVTGNIQWQQASSANGIWADVTGGTDATLAQYTTNLLDTTTWFRAFVTSAGCANDSSNVVSVDVIAAANAGTASTTNTAICPQTSATLTLAGSTGTIQWQISTDGTTWNDETTGAGSASASYTSPILAATTYFRARVSLAPCNDAFSNVLTITISPSAIGGTASVNNSVICSGLMATLSLSGQTGTIRWQRSTDGSTWIDETGVASTFSTYLVTGLTTTTYFRAKLASGSCLDAFSNAVMITVNPTPVGGTSSANPVSVCTGSSATLTVIGYTGSIQWQESANGTNGWISVTGGIGDTTDSYITSMLSATTYYRAVLSNQGCTSQNSSVASVTVISGPVGGTANATTASICTGNTAIINLTGETGTIQWEESADGINGWGNVAAGSGATTSNYTTDVLNTVNYYRARLTSGSCPDIFSNVVTINVDAAAVSGNATASTQIVCSGSTAELTLTGYVGNIQWQESTDGITWNNILGANDSTFTTPTTVGTTYYRAEVTSGNCTPVYSNSFTITVFPEMIATVYTTDESVAGAADGAATVSVTGGMAPYTYNWSNGAITQIVSGLSAGDYSVAMIDASGCMITLPVIISLATKVTNINASVLKAYPNPVATTLIIETIGMSDRIELYDALGKMIYQNVPSTNRITVDMSVFENGIYLVNIYNKDKIYTNKVILQR